MAKNAMVVKDEMSVVVDQIPDFLKGKTGSRGAENVGADDMVIPRVELVQALSPARNKKDSAYIAGAVRSRAFDVQESGPRADYGASRRNAEDPVSSRDAGTAGSALFWGECQRDHSHWPGHYGSAVASEFPAVFHQHDFQLPDDGRGLSGGGTERLQPAALTARSANRAEIAV